MDPSCSWLSSSTHREPQTERKKVPDISSSLDLLVATESDWLDNDRLISWGLSFGFYLVELV